MVDVLTSTLRLTEPTIGGDTAPLWPSLLNSNMAYLDLAINQALDLTMPDTDVTLVADGTVNDQARFQSYSIRGALTADRTLNLPECQKWGWLINGTTGGHNVILNSGAGGTLACQPGFWTRFFCGGSEGLFGIPVAYAGLLSTGNVTIQGSLAVNGGGSFASVLGIPGYQQLPGGFVMAWGPGATGGGGSQAVTFPITFPTAVLNIQAAVTGGSGSGAFVTWDPGFTTSGATFYSWAASNVPAPGVGYDWFVIGH